MGQRHRRRGVAYPQPGYGPRIRERAGEQTTEHDLKAFTEITLDPGEIVGAGKSVNPVYPRTWLRFGRGVEGIQITFTGNDAPLAEKIATVIEAHRKETA